MKNTYHVTRRPVWNWQGKLEGAERASVVRKSKADELKETIEITRHKGNASVYIHGRDGKMKEQRPYPRYAVLWDSKG